MKKILSVILCTALLVSSVLSASFVSAEGKVNSYTGTVNDLNTVKNVYNDIALNTQDDFTGNVALGKTATASGSESDVWTPDKAVDGDKTSADSRWASARVYNVTPIVPQWIALDLEKEVTNITDITLTFDKLAWSTNFDIQTRASEDDEWVTVQNVTSDSGTEQNKVFTINDVTELDRYVRFYFNELNSSAAWGTISIKEIEINGTQLIDPNAPASAAEIMNKITSLPELTVDSTSIELPQVHSDYKIFIKGSEVKNVISLDNEVTPYNIGDRDVSVIVRVENKENAEDYAEKSFVVTVPDKTAEFPNIYPPVENPNEEPAVIPNIQEWYGYTGNFTITSDTRIVYNDEANLGIAKVAENLKEDLLDAYGLDLQVVADTDGNQNDIYIEAMTDDTYDVGDEGYFMITNHLGLKIYAPGYTGAYYGTVTLEQILFQDNTLDVPMGVIRDYPNYEIRGVMIDIARAPYRIQMLKDYEKMLSWYKINEVHLHINDNIHNPNGDVTSYEHWKDTEGYFRLESETFPSLTSTAKSNEYYNESMGGTPSYTKEEWKDLQTYGMDFGVDTITEIDIPGHSLALTKYVYEKVFLHYTTKQWGKSPEEIDNSVTARVPVYISRDDRYFQDKYQGIPLNGYTKMVEKILDHPLIEVKLNTEYNSAEFSDFKRIFCTGSIDEFFNYKYGILPYRSVNFKFETHNCEFYQSNAVVNYPCNYDFTRIHEYKYYLNDRSEKTVIAKEYSQDFEIGKNDRYYPIINEENTKLYEKYKKEIPQNVYFLGRLGDYKYYNMDKAIERAMELFEEIKSNGKS